jgi:hypothetical protein
VRPLSLRHSAAISSSGVGSGTSIHLSVHSPVSDMASRFGTIATASLPATIRAKIR